jgi:sugar lactone lactonase YvrE
MRGGKVGAGALVVALVSALWGFVGIPGAGAAGIPGVGFATSDFATNFPTISCGAPCGPIGLEFDAQGRLLAGGYSDGNLYRFPSSGGDASTHLVGSIGGRPAGLAFGKDLELYAAIQDQNKVVQIDPTSGAVLRTLTTSITFPTALATDPLSGDLFVSQPGHTGDVVRIANPSSVTPTVSTYASPGSTDGITIAADGTLYTETNGCATRIAGTNQTQPPAITTIACVSSMDGIALSNTSTPGQPLLFTNNNDGSIAKIDTSTSPATVTKIVTGGTRGDFVTVGPDGCLYATQSSTIEKVTNADGTCSFVPTSVIPGIDLKPASYLPTLVGTTKSFTAAIVNVAHPGNIAVTFTVTGANPQSTIINTSSNGKAVFSYAGANTGVDSIKATATAGTTALASNAAKIPWESATLTAPLTGTYQQSRTFSGTTYQGGESVAIWWDAVGSGGTLLTTVTATGGGAISGSFKVPSASAGYHALIANGTTSHRRGLASMNVLPAAAVTPPAAVVGATVLVVVHGYGPSELVDFTFNGGGPFATVTSSVNGAAGASFSVPAIQAGSYSVTASGRSSGLVVTKNVTVKASAAVSPTKGPAGTEVTVYGSGFQPNAAVTVKWNCASAACTSTTVLGTATADNTGRFALVDAVIPPDTAAAHTIGAIGGAGTFAATKFTES